MEIEISGTVVSLVALHLHYAGLRKSLHCTLPENIPNRLTLMGE
jgi:hypothetical protein